MMQFSRLLLVIFGIPTLYLTYNLFSVDKSEYNYLIIPFGIVIALILVFHHQIDSWWVKRSKPQMDQVLHSILIRKVWKYDDVFLETHYNTTDHIVYTHDCDFIGKGLETIPDDLKHIISAHAFYFGNSSHRKWPRHYNRIVLYTHPFISPIQEEHVHSVETHKEDGVLVFSLEQAIPGIDRKGSFYNIIIHGFAEAFLSLYPVSSPLSNEEIWHRLMTHFEVDQNNITSVVGLDDFNVLIPVAHYFIYNPEQMKEVFPEFVDTLFQHINV